MSKLTYSRIRHDGHGRYAKEVSAKIKELVDYQGIRHAAVFQEMMNRWLEEMPRRNQFHITDRYRVIKISDNCLNVQRRKDVFSTDFLTIFEIIEHPDQ